MPVGCNEKELQYSLVVWLREESVKDGDSTLLRALRHTWDSESNV